LPQSGINGTFTEKKASPTDLTMTDQIGILIREGCDEVLSRAGSVSMLLPSIGLCANRRS
jgi:hypothetical protein